MTECERLMAEGKIDPGFLCEEERCEYVVSEKMKKIWAISMDLMQRLMQVCQEHNLRVFGICGTAIGAVRHKGFIPWDDDIDVGMPREDYDKLLTLSNDEFGEPYFLQTPYNDESFYNRPFARLRNSNTTGISPGDGVLPCNNGIFIDIFPMDPFEDTLTDRLLITKNKIQHTVAWNAYHHKYAKNHPVLRKILKFFSPIILGGTVKDFMRRHDRQCTKRKNASWVGIQYAFFDRDYKRCLWPTECIEDVVMMPFENMQIPIPSGWDTMLRMNFGDYMQFPPKEVRGKHHDLETEPDVPYKQYCAEKYGVVYK